MLIQQIQQCRKTVNLISLIYLNTSTPTLQARKNVSSKCARYSNLPRCMLRHLEPRQYVLGRILVGGSHVWTRHFLFVFWIKFRFRCRLFAGISGGPKEQLTVKTTDQMTLPPNRGTRATLWENSLNSRNLLFPLKVAWDAVMWSDFHRQCWSTYCLSLVETESGPGSGSERILYERVTVLLDQFKVQDTVASTILDRSEVM